MSDYDPSWELYDTPEFEAEDYNDGLEVERERGAVERDAPGNQHGNKTRGVALPELRQGSGRQPDVPEGHRTDREGLPILPAGAVDKK